jgi:hypothetical protein
MKILWTNNRLMPGSNGFAEYVQEHDYGTFKNIPSTAGHTLYKIL